jgi:hypothetical protein
MLPRSKSVTSLVGESKDLKRKSEIDDKCPKDAIEGVIEYTIEDPVEDPADEPEPVSPTLLVTPSRGLKRKHEDDDELLEEEYFEDAIRICIKDGIQDAVEAAVDDGDELLEEEDYFEDAIGICIRDDIQDAVEAAVDDPDSVAIVPWPINKPKPRKKAKGLNLNTERQ